MTTSLLVDRVKILVLSSGVGAFQLGGAVPGFRGIEALIDGASYSYAVENGSQYEVGSGQYLLSGTQFVRTPQISSNGGAPVPFPANVQLVFTLRASDIAAGGGGGTEPLVSVIGSEAIADGDFVNLFGTGGATTYVRKADASNPARFANAFARGPIANAGVGVAVLSGLNSAVAPGTSQAQVWLSDSFAGGYTVTPPTTDGHIVQPLGCAIPGAGIFFYPQPTVLL